LAWISKSSLESSSQKGKREVEGKSADGGEKGPILNRESVIAKRRKVSAVEKMWKSGLRYKLERET